MSLSKHRSTYLLLTILTILTLDGLAFAAETADWLSHGFGSVVVYSQRVHEGEETLLMDGVLHYAYPYGFQVQYFAAEGPVTITSSHGFFEVKTGNDVQYGYDRYWLFEDVADYLFALAKYTRLPMKYSGADQVAGSKVKRYVAEGDPELMLWLHPQSGLPFLIRQGQKTLVSVVSFVLDLEDPERITSVELDLSLAKDVARLRLDLSDNGWVPSRLTISEPLGEVHIDFSDWSFREEWPENPFDLLTELRDLNDLFFQHYDVGDWEAALQTAQSLLALAPQFWQGYLYQAFVYEALENYLGVVENYQQVLMRQPDHDLALNNLAYHYLLREVHMGRAIEMAERAVELDRKAIYLDTLGYGYYLVGRLEEAKELLLEALEGAPEEAVEEISGHLDLVLQALGDENGNE